MPAASRDGLPTDRAGEYPGDEDPVKARKKIKKFLAAGVRHFVDLTKLSELVPYDAILSEEARKGRSKEELLSSFFYPAPEEQYWKRHPLSPENAEIANGSFKQKQPPAIIGSGFVVRSLEAALCAFYHSDSFRDGALRAVNLGNDADTTGAIYGQLAGAFYGVNAIPGGWVERLTMREFIGQSADALFDFSTALRV